MDKTIIQSKQKEVPKTTAAEVQNSKIIISTSKSAVNLGYYSALMGSLITFFLHFFFLFLLVFYSCDPIFALLFRQQK